jgi:hypothetical protein
MRTMQKGEGVSTAERSSRRVAEYPFNQIDAPGAYLVVASGDLVRVAPEALAPGHSPLVTITSAGDTRVAKLSDNPATPISVLRTIAADNDYFTNF